MKPSSESLHTSAEPRPSIHQAAVDTFFQGLEGHDADLVAGLLADDVILEIPFNASGSTAPAARFEGKGDLVHAASGAPYKNLYVFKFGFRSNLIAQVSEYSNPVIYAKLVGAPIG